MLSFTIGNYQYEVPLNNIAAYVNQTGTFYCQAQIALMSRTHNAIVLGGAFFTSFVGMFDTENERVGLAQSAVTLPGSSLKCISNECDTNVDPTPIEPETPTDGPSDDGEGKSKTRMVLIILGLVILTALCVFAVVWYRRKAEKEDDEDRTSRRKKSGKKGYSISDEKDDDSDEDDNMSIDYKKPMLN